MGGIVKLQMRATVVLLLPCLLLILLLKPYQCLAAESSLGEKVYLQDKEYQGLNVSNGEGMRGETKGLDVFEALTHAKKSGGGGKGGRNMGGGFSQITHQPSSQQQRKSNALPMSSSSLWRTISKCVLLVSLSFF